MDSSTLPKDSIDELEVEAANASLSQVYVLPSTDASGSKSTGISRIGIPFVPINSIGGFVVANSSSSNSISSAISSSGFDGDSSSAPRPMWMRTVGIVESIGGPNQTGGTFVLIDPTTTRTCISSEEHHTNEISVHVDMAACASRRHHTSTTGAKSAPLIGHYASVVGKLSPVKRTADGSCAYTYTITAHIVARFDSIDTIAAYEAYLAMMLIGQRWRERKHNTIAGGNNKNNTRSNCSATTLQLNPRTLYLLEQDKLAAQQMEEVTGMFAAIGIKRQRSLNGFVNEATTLSGSGTVRKHVVSMPRLQEVEEDDPEWDELVRMPLAGAQTSTSGIADNGSSNNSMTTATANATTTANTSCTNTMKLTERSKRRLFLS